MADTYKWTHEDVLRHNARVSRQYGQVPSEVVVPEVEPLRGSKYRNVKTVVDGIQFDSRREAEYWLLLKAREQAGEITGLARQVAYPLYAPSVTSVAGTASIVEVARYVADFVYLEHGTVRVVDAKGRRISPYPLKKKWLYLQSGIEIIEV